MGGANGKKEENVCMEAGMKMNKKPEYTRENEIGVFQLMDSYGICEGTSSIKRIKGEETAGKKQTNKKTR